MKKIFIVAALLAMLSPVFAGESNIRMTIYNRGVFQVSVVNRVKLDKGVNKIKFDNLPYDIIPETAVLTPLSGKGKIKVMEGDFNKETVDMKKLWSRFIGREVEFTVDDTVTVSGVLINFDDSKFYLLQEDNKIEIVNKSEIGKFGSHQLEEGLVASPTLSFQVENKGSAGDYDCELSYLSKGIGWLAYYTMHYLDGKARLSGDFVIENELPVGYDGVELDLIAGSPNMAGDRETLPRNMDMLDAEESGVDSEPLFSYYIYPVTQEFDLPRNTIKHIPFIHSEEYSAEEKNVMKEGFGLRNLETVIEFNSGDTPLPEGEIGVYIDDDKKVSRFVGEDKIYETPAGGMVEIKTGMNFNLQGDRKRISHNRLNRNATEDVIQVKLTNGSDKAELAVVRERLFGVWKIDSATFDGEAIDYKEIDSRKIEFIVELKEHSTSVLQYKVRYEY